MRVVAFILVLASSVSLALVQAYSVEPVRQEWSGWTGFQDTVGQVLTCCWDEMDSSVGAYVELFVGENGGLGAYDLEILLGDTLIAYQYDKPTGRNWDWLPFDSITMSSGQTFTKGKQYEFRFTRSGTDSINFYYNPYDPYKYGDIELPGGGYQPPPTSSDLCMRVYGVMDADGPGLGSHFAAV